MRRTLVARRLAAPVLALSLVGVGGAARAQGPATPAPPGAAAATPTVAPAAAPGLAPAPVTATSAESASPVSLADCVAAAIRDNPDALGSAADVRSAEADRATARGHFGPTVHVDANVQEWDRPFDVNFGGSVRIRDAFTWTAGVTLTQPISALLPIYDQYRVTEIGVDVASIRRAATRRDIAFRTIAAFYRVLESERLADVAQASIVQLEAQEKQAQSQFTNGLIGKNDFLRAGLALATARQRAIQVRGQVILAHGELATSMGRPPGEIVEPTPFTGDLPQTDEPTIESAEAHAVAQRLELRDLARTIEQAQGSVSFAKAKLYPVVNGVGNYTHAEGSAFAQVNAGYVGVTASWDVWDWGTTIGGIHSAEAKLEQAGVAKRKAEDQVRLEARQAFVNAESTREALNVARTSVAQAEENYRIVSKKFENNAATSFDLVDAEGLLTQARGQVEQALYDYLIARSSLQKATGAALPGEKN